MNKSKMSVVLAAMMAVSGLAVAQDTTRAAVKAEGVAGATAAAGTQGGSGPTGAAIVGEGPAKTRAEVKGEITRKDVNTTVQGGSGASKADNPNTQKLSSGGTAAERKAMRDQRRAERKAQRDAGTQAAASGSAPAGSPATAK